MSIGTPVDIGNAGTTVNSGTTLNVTTTASVPAGASIFIAVASSGAGLVSNVTDSASNTYGTASGGDKTIVSGTSTRGSLLTCHNATALNSGSTITVTLASAGSIAVEAFYVTGLAATSTLDQTASNTTTSTGGNAGTTGTTTQADEIAVAVFAIGNSGGAVTFTATAPFTALAGFGASTVQSIRQSRVEYQIVSAIGTFTPAATFGGNYLFCAVVGTYKAATKAPPPPRAPWRMIRR